MRVFVTGATGFIGRALTLRLRGEGHQVVAQVRNVERAKSLLGDDLEFFPSSAPREELAVVLGRCDGVVNLAGEPLLGKRWTAERKKALIESRVGVTVRLVDAMLAAPKVPSVLISGSAVGFYGDRGDETLTEASPGADDFLANLCQDWEAATQPAAAKGVRVVLLRTGIVLGRGGGALQQMLPPFRAGVGGPIGHGRQFMPWIHLHDLVSAMVRALTDARLEGPVNGSGPNPVTSKHFARALGKALHRPAVFPVPGLGLRVLFGSAAAEVMLASQRAVPERLSALGFEFQFRTVEDALADILADGDTRIAPLGKGSPPAQPGSYLEKRGAQYLLESQAVIDAPLEEVFSFFSRPQNLGLLTPAELAFRITTAPPQVEAGSAIDYTIAVGPVPLTWRTRIEHWEAGRLFVDSQEKGPYRSWWHEHHFRADGGRTVVEDRVYYQPPLGVLGSIANRLFVAPMLRQIFGYRADAIRLRFGGRVAAREAA